jgi:WD40 repeat protein
LAFSADSQSIAAVDPDGAQTVLFFDAARGGLIDFFAGHSSPIFKVAISPDGTKIATAGASGTEPLIGMWEAGSGKQIWASSVARVSELAFSPDSELLATPIRLKGHPVRLWDAKSGRAVFDFISVESPGGTLAFTRDGRLGGVVAGTDVDVREQTIGETIQVPRGIDRVVVSPDGQQAVSRRRRLLVCVGCGSEGPVSVWQIPHRVRVVARWPALGVRGRWEIGPPLGSVDLVSSGND